jgi:hypothetical protein
MPIIQVYANSRVWGNRENGILRCAKYLTENQFEVITSSLSETSQPLTCIVNRLLKNYTNKITRDMRFKVKHSEQLKLAIRDSIDKLSDTHYWILQKIFIECVQQKSLLHEKHLSVDVKIPSISTIGKTITRALLKLAQVCDPKYQDIVQATIRSRKDSGRRSKKILPF